MGGIAAAAVRGAASPQTATAQQGASATATRPQKSEAQVAQWLTFLGGGPVLTKLTIGSSDDPLEREADAAADRAMRMEAPDVSMKADSPKIHRKCSECDEEEKPVQRKSESSGMSAASAPPVVESLLGSAGQPLDPATQSFMASRFGHDFSEVRVHTGAQAAQSAAAIGARAYAVGRDIAFGAGQYDPNGQSGRHLLAHELAHVVQQRDAGAGRVQCKLQVGAGLKLDTMGFSHTMTGETYSAPKAARQGSLRNETFSSLLASPRTFAVAGATDQEVTANVHAHMTARIGIVDFAGKKKFSFGAGSDFKMNPEFWARDSKSPIGFSVKPGKSGKDAVNDINNPANVGDPSKEYAIACFAGTLLTVVGGSQSDRIDDSQTGGDDGDWIPGDWGYIQNTNFSATDCDAGLEGENLIYTGKERFWGHFNPGLEYKTLAGWMKEVNEFPCRNNVKSKAVLTDKRRSTKVGLV